VSFFHLLAEKGLVEGRGQQRCWRPRVPSIAVGRWGSSHTKSVIATVRMLMWPHYVAWWLILAFNLNVRM
jgi:hypothetical protein